MVVRTSVKDGAHPVMDARHAVMGARRPCMGCIQENRATPPGCLQMRTVVSGIVDGGGEAGGGKREEGNGKRETGNGKRAMAAWGRRPLVPRCVALMPDAGRGTGTVRHGARAELRPSCRRA